MPIIDIIIIAFIGFGAFKGYQRGLIVEAFGIIAFVVSIAIGFKFLNLGSEAFSKAFDIQFVQNISPYASFIVIIIASGFLIKRMGWMLRRGIRLTFLGSLDSIFGAAIGAFTSLFGISLLLWLVTKTGLTLPQNWLLRAQYFDFAKEFAPNILSKISSLFPGGDWVGFMKASKDKLLK